MRRWLPFLVVVLLSLPARAQPGPTVRVERWLRLPVLDVPWPAFHDESEDHPLELAELLAVLSAGQEDLRPAAGDGFATPLATVAWEEDDTGPDPMDLGGIDASPRVTWAAVYVSVDRFAKAKLSVESPHLLRVFVDGEKVAEKKKADAVATSEGDEPADAVAETGEASADLDLETGQHCILVAAMADPAGPAAWTLRAELALDEGSEASVAFDVDARHAFAVDDLLDVEAVTGIDLSSDGKLLAVSMRHPAAPGDDSATWIDIRDARSGDVVRSFQGVGTLGSFRWDRRESGRFAFVSSEDGKSTLWVGRVDGGAHRAVLRDVEDFGSFRWAGDTLVYTVTEKPKEKHEDIKRYRGIPDRWTGFRNKSYLYQVPAAGGAARRLTAGQTTTGLQDVSPDGQRLLFTRGEYTDDRWPFRRDELFELDLRTLEATSIHETHWGLSAEYAPDGEKLLVLGSPTIFGDVGVDVPEDRIPNEYDQQAYILDRRAKEVVAFTRGFDPTVDEASWLFDGKILLRVSAGSTGQVVVYDPRRERFETLDVPIDVVDDIEVSGDGKWMAFSGTGLNTPQRVYTMSPKPGARPQLMLAVDAERFGRVRYGDVKDFDFQASSGTTIVGRVYYPPAFDASRRYPAIVYYYGGTSPVERSFGGRYPKELWAAQGYVVYVLQPSGATGFGQEFSSRHVNNWGKTVAGEIVEGTQAFLAQHRFVDPERVGCIGASYGGFMTMLLVTQTDIFAAAVSHAGISSIASYWGEGWWGHLYSAAATAHSYPWNRADVYVDQSPLFHADEVNTPLLLLHGGDDNNVPPGESEQMYSALRVLGKDVELVRVAGERHWILDYDKRKLWTKTIVAWFDWKLKNQPQWWDHLYADEE